MIINICNYYYNLSHRSPIGPKRLWSPKSSHSFHISSADACETSHYLNGSLYNVVCSVFISSHVYRVFICMPNAHICGSLIPQNIQCRTKKCGSHEWKLCVYGRKLLAILSHTMRCSRDRVHSLIARSCSVFFFFSCTLFCMAKYVYKPYDLYRSNLNLEEAMRSMLWFISQAICT